MAHTVDSTPQNAASALRGDLDLLEKRAVRPDAATIEALLLQLDDMDRRFDALEAENVDLRAERVRWDNVLRRFNSRPALLANAAAKAGGMATLRAAHAPAEGWWWHADEELGRRRRRLWIQTGSVIVAIVAIAILGWLVVTHFFPPDADAVATLDATTTISRQIQDGQWDKALETARERAAQRPDNLELAMWVVALSKRAGEPVPPETDAAVKALLASNPLQYWLQLGEAAMYLDTPDMVLDAGRNAVAVDPQSAEAHFLLGRAAVLADDRALALDELDTAAKLAQDSNPRLSVSARMVWADLLQRPEVPTDTPAPDSAP